MRLQFLTMPDCLECEKGKKIIEEIKPDFPDLEIEEIDMTTPEGQEMIQEYQIMASPAIIIGGDLFSTGCPDKEELIKRLKSKDWKNQKI